MQECLVTYHLRATLLLWFVVSLFFEVVVRQCCEEHKGFQQEKSQ